MENSDYKILLADDEPDVLEFLGYNLTREGYQIYKALNGKEALSIAIDVKPHLIILDVMMPVMDGIEACKEMKKIVSLQKTIIAFLSARNEDYSQIAGLDAGADDYIAKPIKPKVFISRVKALLRRFTANDDMAEIISIADLVIDKAKYLTTRKGKEIVLPKKEFELLCLLASHANKVLSRDKIYAEIWKGVVVGERTIDVHVRRIREKLGIDNIRTIKGVGYKFEVSA